MGDWVDWLGIVALDAGGSASVLLGFLTVGVVVCRQPGSSAGRSSGSSH